eukprot:15439288-Alexandrium_andersonii.AAC.1
MRVARAAVAGIGLFLLALSAQRSLAEIGRSFANSQGLRGLWIGGLQLAVRVCFEIFAASGPLSPCFRRRIRKLRER